MAVTARVLIQVFLVVFFGGEKIPNRFNDNREVHSHLFLLPSEDFADRWKLPLISIVDTCPILDSDIVSLPVDCQRIDHHEVILKQFFQVHSLVIIVYPDGLCMTAVSANILVARRSVRPIRITGFCTDHSVKLIKELLEPPEASTGKINRIHNLFSFPLCHGDGSFDTFPMRLSLFSLLFFPANL